eukprot:IDg3440t1
MDMVPTVKEKIAAIICEEEANMDAFLLLNIFIGGLMDCASVLPKTRQLYVSPRAIEARPFRRVISAYSRKNFQRAFRMSPETFAKLLYKVRSDLVRCQAMGSRSGRPIVESDVRLGVTMRMLAGASYLDIISSYSLCVSTVYSVFADTVHVLQNCLTLPGLPETKFGLRSLSNRFKSMRGSPLTGCVGALDGICMRIRKPNEEERPAAYYCRKGYYAVPVQALVDCSYRFLSFSGKCVGSTNDSLAHGVSCLGHYLKQKSLDPSFWIVGDEAYSCDESLITPVPSSQAGPDDINLNYYLSSYRVVVEQAFGLLVARWRILKGGLNFSVKQNVRVMCLCMKLHNFCEENDEPPMWKQLSAAQNESLIDEARTWYTLCRDAHDSYIDHRGRGELSTSCSLKREILRDIVKASGRTRPENFSVVPRRGVSIARKSEAKEKENHPAIVIATSARSRQLGCSCGAYLSDMRRPVSSAAARDALPPLPVLVMLELRAGLGQSELSIWRYPISSSPAQVEHIYWCENVIGPPCNARSWRRYGTVN